MNNENVYTLKVEQETTKLRYIRISCKLIDLYKVIDFRNEINNFLDKMPESTFYKSYWLKLEIIKMNWKK